MRFWFREIVGWLLLVLGLVLFYFCFVMLQSHWIIEAGPLTLIAIIVFRGGIHLIKVAVAARVCMKDRERPAGPGPASQGARPATRAVPARRGAGQKG